MLFWWKSDFTLNNEDINHGFLFFLHIAINPWLKLTLDPAAGDTPAAEEADGKNYQLLACFSQEVKSKLCISNIIR